MTKIICAPAKYIQGKHELQNLYQHASVLASKGAYVVVDSFILDHHADAIRSSFAGTAMPVTLERFGGECSHGEIDRIVADLRRKNADIVIGIGGGKTLDTAKAAGYYAELPVVICPTIASTDAPCSALSVLYTDDGQFDQYLYLRSNPNVVLVDTAIIAAAPVRLLVAGMGDALATYFEARSCVASGAITSIGGNATKAAFALARQCYDILLVDGYKAKAAAEQGLVTKAVENIIEANTYLSGIGFESCGLAAAHAVHNGLTVLPETHAMAHGEKVAFGTLTQLVLENADDEEIAEVLEFCLSVGLPTCLADLGVKNPTPEQLMAVANATCAEGETIHNLPFPVTPEDVYAAILVADSIGAES